MMRISLIALTACFAISPLTSHACPTDDLFAAIEAQNIELVKQALEAGARTDAQRPRDGLDAKTFAFNQVTGLVGSASISMIASLGLLMASSAHNKYYALASLAGFITAGYLSWDLSGFENSSGQNTALDSSKQQTSTAHQAATIIRYASAGGLLASAWTANELILSSIGTAGLSFFIYQIKKFETAQEIYKLVDPEQSLYSKPSNSAQTKSWTFTKTLRRMYPRF
jgi:hypothetical protein